MRHNASPPSTPPQSQRAGNNHWIKARPKSWESQIKWCVSSVLIRSVLSVGHTTSTSAHNWQSVCMCVWVRVCLQHSERVWGRKRPRCRHPCVIHMLHFYGDFHWLRFSISHKDSERGRRNWSEEVFVPAGYLIKAWSITERQWCHRSVEQGNHMLLRVSHSQQVAFSKQEPVHQIFYCRFAAFIGPNKHFSSHRVSGSPPDWPMWATLSRVKAGHCVLGHLKSRLKSAPGIQVWTLHMHIITGTFALTAMPEKEN